MTPLNYASLVKRARSIHEVSNVNEKKKSKTRHANKQAILTNYIPRTKKNESNKASKLIKKIYNRKTKQMKNIQKLYHMSERYT